MKTKTIPISFSRLALREGFETVLTVAMVCNDLAVADVSMSRYGEMSSLALSHIKRGAAMYFMKMSCGHLQEGMKAIEKITQSCELRALVDRCGPRAQTGFTDLCGCLKKGAEHGQFEKYVGSIRNRVAFHYDPSMLRSAVDRRTAGHGATTGFMTVGEDIRSCRFEFADDILDTIVCRKFWHIPDEADVRLEADRITGWCDGKRKSFLWFAEELVPRFLQEH
jgi:hypothetical protein